MERAIVIFGGSHFDREQIKQSFDLEATMSLKGEKCQFKVSGGNNRALCKHSIVIPKLVEVNQ